MLLLLLMTRNVAIFDNLHAGRTSRAGPRRSGVGPIYVNLFSFVRQWRRKQFASGGIMPARSAGRKIVDVPLTFLLCPHMRGTTIVCYQLRDNSSGEVGRGAIKVMGPSTYSYTHTHSISSAPITGRPWVHYKQNDKNTVIER